VSGFEGSCERGCCSQSVEERDNKVWLLLDLTGLTDHEHAIPSNKNPLLPVGRTYRRWSTAVVLRVGIDYPIELLPEHFLVVGFWYKGITGSSNRKNVLMSVCLSDSYVGGQLAKTKERECLIHRRGGVVIKLSELTM
jgi:hypothetical protein